MSNDPRVVVIGAGVTGLTAAYRLAQRGFKVTVVEAAKTVGGLAGSIEIDGRWVEKYYHFICRGDHDLVDFIGELGLADKLHWKEAGTSCYVEGREYAFNTPLDLLRFSAIPFLDRIRFGLHVLAARYRHNWQNLDGLTAKKWLIAGFGLRAYTAIWDPLLRIKFGAFHEEVSAAWIWHRIRRVAESREGTFAKNSYGFLEQGCATLLDGILTRLQGPSEFFRLEPGTRVSEIATENGKVMGVVAGPGRRFIPADAVISTAAIPALLKLIPHLGTFSADLGGIRYLNVACLLCQLDRPFSKNFWLNVNDRRLSINGIIELTNLNPRPDLPGAHLLYIPYYLHDSDPRWGFSDEQIYGECMHALQTIRPDFTASWIKNWWVSRDLHAQAVCRAGFLDSMPGYETPVKGLYMTDSAQYYPEDRTLSASVRLGREVAALVAEDRKTSTDGRESQAGFH